MKGRDGLFCLEQPFCLFLSGDLIFFYNWNVLERIIYPNITRMLLEQAVRRQPLCSKNVLLEGTLHFSLLESEPYTKASSYPYFGSYFWKLTCF